MEEIWRSIDIWLQKNAPRVFSDLLPGAASDEIESIELELKFPLPEDFKTSLTIHDGQDGRFRLVEPWELIPTNGLVSESQQMIGIFRERQDYLTIETLGSVKPMIWNEGWIPFAADGAGNLCCLDLDPDMGGSVGQVIHWASDPPYVEVIAPSYRAWLEQFLADLEANRYTWDEENTEWTRVD